MKQQSQKKSSVVSSGHKITFDTLPAVSLIGDTDLSMTYVTGTFARAMVEKLTQQYLGKWL